MPNPYFRFKQFTIHHDRCAMKVATDSCLFGAWAAKEMRNADMRNVLDIGTGTGLLSLMIAQKNDVEIDAIEIDKEASLQSMENIEASPWKGRIHVFNEDIRSFRTKTKYDCIISNPPFYENELASAVRRKNIAHHSEELTISAVFKTIREHLREKGVFFLLLPFKRHKEIESLLRQNQLYLADEVMVCQSVAHAPFRLIIKGSREKTIARKSVSVPIWNEHQQYTQDFIDLLKDYYLYL